MIENTERRAPARNRKPLTFCLFGGATDCFNLGVAALGTGTITGLKMGFPDARIIVQTYDTDPIARVQLASGAAELESIQAWSHQNLRDRTSITHLRKMGRITRRLGTWSASYNRALRLLMESDVILDISGGDSFADIYGDLSFEYQASLKLLARDLGKPLVLLPQTYGPFTRPASIEASREILDYATISATREVHGMEEMERVYGRVPERVVKSPDVAFLMKPVPVAAEREPFIATGAGEPLIGLNVSGLLYFRAGDYGIAGSYPDLMEAIAAWAMEKCRARLLLVPHVIAHEPLKDDLSQYDPRTEASDTLACKMLMSKLEKKYAGRVGCVGWPYGPAETKYFLGRCDFAIGARMHACIGAISQAVPTVTLAYSKKALGVMSHLDMGQSVVDLRTLSVDAAMADIALLYDRRAELAAGIQAQLPAVQARVTQFFTTVLPAALKAAV